MANAAAINNLYFLRPTQNKIKEKSVASFKTSFLASYKKVQQEDNKITMAARKYINTVYCILSFSLFTPPPSKIHSNLQKPSKLSNLVIIFQTHAQPLFNTLQGAFKTRKKSEYSIQESAIEMLLNVTLLCNDDVPPIHT